MQIAAQHAVVKTAAVEIKALTVSGKQVTLAVFRQLDEANIIDLGTMQLKGVPWGRVNYHPDKCGDSSTAHLHIVWQNGDSLFRDSVAKAFDRTSSGYNYIEALRQKARRLKKVRWLDTEDQWHWSIKWAGQSELTDTIERYWDDICHFNVGGRYNDPYADPSDVNEFASLIEDYQTDKAAYDAVASNLQNLDLLFIAV